MYHTQTAWPVRTQRQWINGLDFVSYMQVRLSPLSHDSQDCCAHVLHLGLPNNRWACYTQDQPSNCFEVWLYFSLKENRDLKESYCVRSWHLLARGLCCLGDKIQVRPPPYTVSLKNHQKWQTGEIEKGATFCLSKSINWYITDHCG